jgi:aminopeptidase N
MHSRRKSKAREDTRHETRARTVVRVPDAPAIGYDPLRFARTGETTGRWCRARVRAAHLRPSASTSSRSPFEMKDRPLHLLALALAAGLATGCESIQQGLQREPTPRPRFATLAEHPVPDRGYDVEHYAIDLVLHPELRRIEGACRIRYAPLASGLDEVVLDLDGLDVHDVRDQRERSLTFTREGDELRVRLLEAVEPSDFAELTVRYSGAPRTGLWFSGQRGDGSGPTQVFTHGQAEENRGWFPCLDHPSDRATSEIRVTLPDHWVSIAPGERIDSTTTGDGLRTDHWRMTTPHPSYLVSLVAGELHVERSEWDGIPLVFAAEPQYRAWMEATFEETDEILDFLSDYTGVRYPYPKYSQVCVANFPWGGMENISATTLTPLTLGDDRRNRDQASTGLVAHEAAHQWFGDLFTCRDWSHVWLNEGFASYMTLLYFEETDGVDRFRVLVREAQDQNLEEDRGDDRRPTVWKYWKDPEDLMDTRAYQGAAARLHLLRFVLGDDAFRAGVRTYAAENVGRSVVTDDLQRAMEKVSGRDLDTFFRQWIHGAGVPEFELEWEYDDDDQEVTLHVRQVQFGGGGTTTVFELPVEVEVRDDGGTVTHRVELRNRKERFTFPVAGRPTYVRFDKNGWIPKRVEWKKRGVAEWLAIAHEDDDVNGRRDAIRALGQLGEFLRERGRLDDAETVVAELVDRLFRDGNEHVRAAAAKALGRARGLEARERLIVAVGRDESALVRAAGLEALSMFDPGEELAEVAERAFDEGYSWNTMGAAAGLMAAAAPDRAYAWITQKLFIDSPHDLLRASLFAHLGELKNDGVNEQLRRWALDDSVHPAARGAAVEALGKRRRDISGNSRFIAGFLDEENFRLRRSAVGALARLGGDNARRALRAHYTEARTSGERRAIEAVLSGPDL